MTSSSIQWDQAQWLLSEGVPSSAIIKPSLVMTCRGTRADDGRFNEDIEGPQWLMFLEEHDLVFWQPMTGELASDTGRAFALSEHLIDSLATTAFDQYLNIFADPLEWLQNERRGIVVLQWRSAFDRLRAVARVAVSKSVLPHYRCHMRPFRLPKLAVLPKFDRGSA